MLKFTFEQTITAEVVIEGLEEEFLTDKGLATINDIAHAELLEDTGTGHEFLFTFDGQPYKGKVEPEEALGWDYDQKADFYEDEDEDEGSEAEKEASCS